MSLQLSCAPPRAALVTLAAKRDNPGFSRRRFTPQRTPMQDKLIGTGLTFDDVLIEPRYSDVVPA
ncbi:MAG TPA: hypothetical protein PJ982_16625, partial [Lacipirellulaceae bacterium]|nr:hypothetical protein [Lacipirellulaceae bacterium]